MEAAERRLRVQQEFLKHASFIRGFLVGLLADLDAAEDVLQEVFLAATEKAADFQIGSNFLAWVQAIARFKALEHYRSRAMGPKSFAPEVVEVLASSAPTDEEDFSERQAALRRCLQALAHKARMVLEFRYGGGLGSREIARRIGWRPAAVDVALSKARRFLRECVRRRLGLARIAP